MTRVVSTKGYLKTLQVFNHGVELASGGASEDNRNSIESAPP